MKEVILTKKAKASNGKNPLENFSKLKAYASQASKLAKKQASEKGIAFTIIKNGKVYKVLPDGSQLEDKQHKMSSQILFEPIKIVK